MNLQLFRVHNANDSLMYILFSVLHNFRTLFEQHSPAIMAELYSSAGSGRLILSRSWRLLRFFRDKPLISDVAAEPYIVW